MPEFLAEQYEPGVTEAGGRTRIASLRQACDAIVSSRASRVQARVISATFVPADEALLIEFEADSLAAVEEVADRAGLKFDRVSETVPLGAPSATAFTAGNEYREETRTGG